MSVDVFGNSPAMTAEEMFAEGLITDLSDDAELTEKGLALQAAVPDPYNVDLDGQILTVGRLRQILAGMPDEAQVVMDDRDSWYCNVAGIGLPAVEPFDQIDSSSEWSAVTLKAGLPIDTRQF